MKKSAEFDELDDLDPFAEDNLHPDEDPATPRPVALFLGYQPSGAVLDSVRGRHYAAKMFHSSPLNWLQIVNLLRDIAVSNEAQESQVICRISTLTAFTAVRPEYAGIWEQVISAIAPLPHRIFIYDALLSGSLGFLEDKIGDLTELDIRCQKVNFPGGAGAAATRIERLCADLSSRDLRLSSYETQNALEADVIQFVRDWPNSLVMRLYLPSERLWSDELDKLLSMFKDYLTRVAGKAITLKQSRTERGVSFSFFSRLGGISSKALAGTLNEFTELLDLCTRDPNSAVDKLIRANIDPNRARELVTRYHRDARRLALDLDYARDRAVREIEYRLKSEILDLSTGDLPNSIVTDAVGESLTLPVRLSSIFGFAAAPISVQELHLHNPQFIQKAEGIIAATVNGGVNYTRSDEAIMKLIRDNTEGVEKLELQSALDELRDDSAPKEERQDAKTRLSSFLRRVASKGEDLALNVLFKYLENLANGRLSG